MISPYAKQNYVDNTQTDQTSVLRFIEDNWSLGRTGLNSMDNKAGSLTNMFEFTTRASPAPKVFLNTASGEVMGTENAETGEPSEPGETGGGKGGGSGHGGHGSGGEEESSPEPAADVRCKIKGVSHKVSLRCKVSGGGDGAGAIRFRVVRGKKVLGTSRATLGNGTIHTVLRSKAELNGSYRLLVTIDRKNEVSALSQAVKLPGRASVHLH